MSHERDYVNEPLGAEGYDGDIPDERRCQYEFRRSHEFRGRGERQRRDVQGRPCGLLAVGDIEEGTADRCVFHHGLPADFPPWREHDAWLADALRDICDRAYLGEANLVGANLSGAVLQDANLSGAEVWCADLSGAKLRCANLSGADLRGADLSGAALRWADLSGADLRGATIEPVWVSDGGNMRSRAPDLRDAILSGALLTNMSLAPGANLEGAEIDCPIRDELSALDARTLRACESVYRQLKLNFQESGDYQRAGEFYLRERECYRAWAKDKGRWLEWLGQSLVYYVCGHGERPGWVMRCTVGLIVLFAWIQGCLGIAGGDGELLVGGWGAPAWEPFRQALYFSTVTFTSLGYGDMRPVSAWGETAAGIEAALGLVLMSLLLVSIVRRFSR